MITDTFTLKRDTAAENAAVKGIISLFTDKWGGGDFQKVIS